MYHPLKQWLTGRKEGKTKLQKIEYLDKQKSFLDEIKNNFHFLKDNHLVKNKNLIKNSGHKPLRRDYDTGFSREFCKIFEKTFCIEHLRAPASELLNYYQKQL